MPKAVELIKTHWFKILVIAILAALIIQPQNAFFGQTTSLRTASYDMAESRPMADSYGGGSVANMAYKVSPPLAPNPGGSVDVSATDRLVQRNASMSLLVKDVRSAINVISDAAKDAGGFIVNSSVNRPAEGGSGHISIRVPSKNLDVVMSHLRDLSVQVVSESINANDVTDQFKDIEARLVTLQQTKATFEGMLSKAQDVDEILRVQESIFRVQDQIDALKGEKDYLAKTAESSLISVSLSTDELALPYSPSDPWRPSVVFKTAVRSMVLNLRQLANLGIWLVVYLPMVTVIGIASWLVFKLLKRYQNKSTN